MKPNYFTIHKNKLQKRIKRKAKKINPFLLQIPLVAPIGAAQLYIKIEQPIPVYGEKYTPALKEQKEKEAFDILKNTTSIIMTLNKESARFEFERTHKYKRNYAKNI